MLKRGAGLAVRFGLVALLTPLLRQTAVAQVFDEASRPGMAVAWGIFVTPALDLLGAMGPGSKLGPVETTGNAGGAIYLQKTLQETLMDSTKPVSRFVLDSPLSGLDAAFASLTAPYIAKPITEQDLYALGQQLTERVKANKTVSNVGFDLEPSSEGPGAEGLVIRVHVQPLTVRGVEIEEGQHFRQASVRPRLNATVGKPLNLTALSTSIRYIQDNPDLELETSLEPVEFTNDVTVHVKINDQFPLHAGANVANIGLNVFGETLYGGAVVHNNLLGLGDTFMFSPVASRRGGIGLISHYEIPLGHHGTVLSFEHAYNHARAIGPDYTPFQYRGHSNVSAAAIRQALYSSDAVRVTADIGLQIKNAQMQADSVLIEKERMRNFIFGLQMEQEDDSGNTFARQEIGWAADIFGASRRNDPLLSIPSAGSQSIRFTTTAAREQNLFWDSTLLVQGMFQYTPDSLYTSDQFGAGGFFFGRGYKEQFYGADTAAYVSGEWKIPLKCLPKNWKVLGTEEPLGENIQLVTFIDYTLAHLNDQDAGVDSTDHFLGAGVGVRAKLAKFLEARLDVGFPLLQQPEAMHPRLHFGVSSVLL